LDGSFIMRQSILSASALGCSLICAPAAARGADRAEVQSLKAEVQLLKKQLEALSRRVAQVEPALPPTGRRKSRAGTPFGSLVPPIAVPPAAEAPNPATQETTTLASRLSPAPAPAHHYFDRKPGAGLTFYVPSGEITAYGNFDISLDGASKGIGDLHGPGGTKPVGITGWQADISTNLSYVGVRGFEAIPNSDLNLVYQFETQIDISASSGIAETNSSESNVVKGGLTTRNTYLGIANATYGALLIGKTDAPYKQSTAIMNPFLGEWGDYGVIMGNTGGDNRVEFATRLDHSIWYESPTLTGFKLTALFSPGQNRASTSDNIGSGESDCTGGNIPGSGGSLPYACNDGSFSDAVSASLSFTHGPLYVVVAYERHSRVNRASDLTGEYASPPASYLAADIAAEDAAKIGAQYIFPTHTTISAIFEDLHRYIPGYLNFQNERQRTGTWLEAGQRITSRDQIFAGWAHAGRTPGDPGQHNTSLVIPPFGQPGDGVGGTGANNAANLFTAAYKHDFGAGLSTYIDWAEVLNGPYAHYALGAGGRPITADCHDASDATGDLSSNPHCWAGGHAQGVSLGLKYQF
jgi:predicted porin